ncbi:MAG: hypothetical protein GY808_01595, partial [Gammaproteobacteria bacterium]|nr:hypothetical protein [Gammaproteobacteria bacterium]
MKTRLFVLITIILAVLWILINRADLVYAQPSEFDCSRITEISQSECEALIALHNSTNGINWFENEGWLATETPCNWHGITCELGHIKALNLSKNNLKGEIPSELSKLVKLRELDLSCNTNFCNSSSLVGSIPPELSQLNELERIDFHWTDLSGEIPSELGQLNRLKYLDLNSTDISGPIPPNLGNLDNLEYLDLSNSSINNSIPPELGDLDNLQYLDLSDNNISGEIPIELGQLIHLERLYLSHTNLGGPIPVELSQLNQLKDLGLFRTKINGTIPAELGNLNNLESLSLGCSDVSGSVPPQLGQLTELRILILSCYPRLHGPISLTGPLPLTLMNLKKLEKLWIENGKLCEPPNEEFQNWLSNIQQVNRGGIICDDLTYLPETGSERANTPLLLIGLGIIICLF